MNPYAPAQGAAQELSYEDYVGMSGVAKAWGLERMLQHYRIDMATWTQIATSWNQKIPSDMARYGTYGMLVEQEAARVTTGGPPRVLAAPGAQQPYAPPGAQQQYGQQQFERDASNFGNALGSAAASGFSALGNAFGGLGKAMISVGARVLVTWTDGNRYPGTVAQVAQGQYLITMGDGQQHWIQASYVTLG